MTFKDVTKGTLTRESLMKIVQALNYYVDEQEKQLSQVNASDMDWQRVKDYKDMCIDIEFYLLSSKNRL